MNEQLTELVDRKYEIWPHSDAWAYEQGVQDAERILATENK